MKIFIVTVLCFAALPAYASGNVIYYNGKPYDDRYGAPKHFTGERSYVDMETKKVSSREQLVDDVQEGPYVKYDIRTGRVEESGNYHDGKFHGVRKRWGNDGKLEQEYAYANGELRGVQKSYRDGVVQRIYLMVSGSPSPDVELYFTKKGQLSQLRCGKRSISKQDAEWCGQHGKQSTVSLYGDDGKVRATEQYLWGKKNGTFKRYNSATGAVMTEEQYVDGKSQKDGARNFDKSGAMLSKTDCDATRTSCTETLFFEGGKEVKSETAYKKGKLAARKERYQNGKVSEELVVDGDHVQIARYDDEGQVTSRGTYVEASDWYWQEYVPDGEVQNFSHGALRSKEHWIAGRLDGPSQEWWTVDAYKLRVDSSWTKDHLVTQKFYVDERLVLELAYMPDGSIKSRTEHTIPKGIPI